MTDDLRAKAIEAMKEAILLSIFGIDADLERDTETVVSDAATAAFDAQNGIVRVVPPQPTDEMIAAFDVSKMMGELKEVCITASNRFGDLTRPGK